MGKVLHKRRKLGKKNLGIEYFWIETINNPYQILITVNPKKYYKHFGNFSNNKKHKGVKKGKSGMVFKNAAARIAISRQTKNSDASKNKYIIQSRFTIVGGETQQ